MKRLFAFLLALTMMVSLCACNDPAIPGGTTAPATEDPKQTAPVDPTECSHDQLRREEPATCVQPGQIILECKLCGEILTEETPATGHSFTDATCVNAKCCTVCGITDGDALGHSYVSGICDRCGAKMPGYEEKPVGCSHQYSLTAQIAPSCTTGGSFTYTCGSCGNAYTESVKAKGHIYSDATCSVPKTCHVCGITEGTELGHHYVSGLCIRCGAPDPSVPVEITYTVTVRTDKGALVEGVTVSIYTTDGSPAAVGTTNSMGVATMTLLSAPSYKLILSDLPQGFSAKASYTFRSTAANINLTTVPYTTPTDHSKGNYKVGSIMGEFTLTDTDGNSYTLSKMLKEKKLIILNFWYVSCVPCKAEFPHFEAVYKNYAKDVQLLTMSHFDSEAQIKALRQQMGVTFPMIAENIGFQQGFGLEMYPTTVFIGSSGKILRIKVGDFKNEQEFIDSIETFLK